MVIPMFICDYNDCDYNDNVVEYDEKLVKSKYFDNMPFYFKRKNTISWWNKFWLDDGFSFIIKADKKWSKHIKKEMTDGSSFSEVYRRYKEIASIGGLAENNSEWNHHAMTIDEFLPRLSKYYQFDFVVIKPRTWYERDYSSRRVKTNY